MLKIKARFNLNKRIPGRSVIILSVCFVAWCVLIGRLFYLQVLNYDEYRGKVIDNVQHETPVNTERGIIYDSNMVQLASNYTVWRVFISPRDITDDTQARKISQGLSEILEVDYDKIYNMTQKKKRADETVKKQVEEDKAEQVRTFISENELSSQIHLEASTKRYYSYGSLASSVVGFTGTDGGLLGLELEYDDYLAGTSGTYITAKNGQGTSMPYKYDSYAPGDGGANLVTTIDVTIQYMLEQQLQKTYADSMPINRVTGIVMNPNTGAVLAMATYPTFDCNSPWTLDADSQKKLDESGYDKNSEEYSKYYNELLYALWKNKAVSEIYEPGSTFKVITTAMALEENVVSLDERFYCKGHLMINGYDKPIHCHKRQGHGSVTFEVGLQQSCNPVLMTIGMRVGTDRFYNYLKAFGFMEKTGIDLPGEATSYLHAYDSFNQVQLAVYSFGQTFKVTPLQQLTAISTVANGGNLITPYVVSQIIDDGGNVLYAHETDIKRQVVSSEVCSTISGVLERGVSGDGGAKNAYVSGYKIAAKTGTSEVRDVLNEAGEAYLRVGSTVAYAPADDPQVAMIIVVDSPQCESVYGSVVAAPYIASLMEQVLPYIGVERNYTDEEAANLEQNIRDYSGWSISEAKSSVSALGLKCQVKGEGDVVTYQIPKAGEAIDKQNGKVILYTGEAVPEADVAVPKLIGMSASNANARLANAGLNINITGATNYENSSSAAVVVSQSPAEGEMVIPGTVVTIELRFMDGTAN